MANNEGENRIEESIVRDKKLIFTAISYGTTLIIFLNLKVIVQVLPQELAMAVPLVGSISSFAYFLINGIFIGHFFFKDESLFLKLALGVLLVLCLLGFVAWGAIIVSTYLDATLSVTVMIIVATLASLLNRLGHNQAEARGSFEKVGKASAPTEE